MSRILSRALTGTAVVLFALCPVWAAEKTVKESPSIAAARKQVEAALKAEAAGDNERRARLVASAVESAPALPEANWQSAHVHVVGKWLTLAEAEQHTASDPIVAEYHKLLDEAKD